MRQGKRHGGAGKQVFGNGRGYYDGGWERDKPQGMGTRVYVNITGGYVVCLELWLYLYSVVVMFHHYWCIRKP